MTPRPWPFLATSWSGASFALALGLASGAQSPGATPGEDTAPAAALLAASCSGCHGSTGTAPAAVPSLEGLSADHIRRAMLDYRADRRPATVMNRIAKGYSEADIEVLARHLARRADNAPQEQP
ncbi:MAG: c-type cytochrome [Candidatus Competibacterales bacterium]